MADKKIVQSEVDTQSEDYLAGYDAGYAAGLAAGYTELYDDGMTMLDEKIARGPAGEMQAVKDLRDSMAETLE